MTKASPACETFGSVNIKSVPGQREKSNFYKNEFSLAVSDGRSRSSLIQKLATSVLPGAEWVLKPTGVTLIRASDSKVLTDHELSRLSNSANVLPGPVLRDTCVTAVIK